MAQPRADQHQGGISVRECPHHPRPPADFPVQPLDHVVGADARPVLAGKIAVGQRFLNAVLDLLGSLLQLHGAQLGDHSLCLLAGRLFALLSVDRLEHFRYNFSLGFGHNGEHIAVEMHRAALVFGVRKHLAHGLQHPHTLVADDELHAIQAASAEPLEEADPAGLVLLHALGSAKNLTETVLIHGDRHQNRHIFVLSAPVAAQIDAVHIDIRIAPALQGTVPPILNVNVGFLVQLADGGGRNLAAPQRLGDVLYPAHGMETRRKVNVVGAINGGGFDMSNGRPSGALVLDGTVIQSANSTTFWVDKDNVAHITDGTEYNQAVADGHVSEAISSFGDILSDGKAYTGLDNSTRTSRTAVGIKQDGSVVLFMVDGRQSPYSTGMTMAELAAAMEKLGCERAINLDGGGSSTFATQREVDVVSEVDPNGKSAGLTLRCRPSDGYERRVSNTLMVLSSAKATGEFDHAVLMPNNEIYTPGSTVAFKASGVDGGGFPMNIPAGASWSLTKGAALGSINAQTGVFTANEGAEGTVSAALTVNGKVAGTTQIELHWPDTLGFTNNSVSLDFGKTSDMTFKPTWNGREVRYKDGDFVWSLDESEEISYKYTALVEEKGYGFSQKWNGGKPFKWTGPNLDQKKTPWGVAPKIFMSLTGNIGETQMIEWGAGDGSTYQTYFTEKSASYQVGADGTITVQELLTHDKAEKLTDDGWKECTEDENTKLVNLEHAFTIGRFENNQFVADKKNSRRAMAQVVLKANPSVSGSIELVVGLEPLVLFDFEAPDASTSIESYWNTYVEPGSDNHEANNGHGGQLSADEIQKYRLWVRSGAGRVGANYAGSGVVTGKENGVRFGEGAYKLAYDFNQVSATAPIAADFGYSCDLLVNMQQPTKIGMWVNVPAARKNDDSILKVISAGGANSTVDGNGYNKLNANGTFTFVEGKIGMYTLRVLNTLQLFM